MPTPPTNRPDLWLVKFGLGLAIVGFIIVWWNPRPRLFDEYSSLGVLVIVLGLALAIIELTVHRRRPDKDADKQPDPQQQ